MELKDFIQESLLSIVDAVNEAQVDAIQKGTLINPGGLSRNYKNVEPNAVWDNGTNNYARNINFDIAITAEDQAKGGAKIKVLSGLINGDLGGETTAKNSMVSRIQFSIPVLLPPTSINDEKAREGQLPIPSRIKS